MPRPLLLDLFCGAGGAAMGYHRAGFTVVGVDIKPQPRYPFTFYQEDALVWLGDFDGGFDAIHASPPCQAYSSATRLPQSHPDLYAPTRDLLVETGLPYVLENVVGAPYSSGIVLCGAAFGLEADGEWLRRHRNFETSWLVFQPPHPHRRDKRAVTITGHALVSGVKEYGHSRQGSWDLAQRLMGIDWMTREELREAIPPAYTEYVGAQLLEHLGRSAQAVTG